MSVIEKLFGIINGIYLFGIIYILSKSAAIVGFLSGTLGLLIILLFILFIIILGSIISIKHIRKKTKDLNIFEKLLILFPLLNLAIIVVFIIASICF